MLLCYWFEKLDFYYNQSECHWGRWALSLTRASHMAYPNRWFIQVMGQRIKSEDEQEQWFELDQWIKIT